MTLSHRFLLAAVLVMALAMFILGNWIGHYLEESITQGVSSASATSIDALVSHELEEHGLTAGPVTDADRARLDTVFAIGNGADSPRLLQIRITDLTGAILYQSLGGLIEDKDTKQRVADAMTGTVSSELGDFALEPVGPVAQHSIAILKIYTPLHRPGSRDIFAAAELYYGAKPLLAILSQAQTDVWLIVGLIGLCVIGVLYILVDRASRTILAQRKHLAANLAASRALSEENHALHAASEQLRLQANSANESLLAQVGSDIHDGPIQLLTLIILRLTNAAGARGIPNPAQHEAAATIKLATEAIEELRNISSGLVLPELETLSLNQTLLLAISRHEEATGVVVSRSIGNSPSDAPVAVKICAYRVVQEALNNAYRHGAGSDAEVSARQANGMLSLVISNVSEAAIDGPTAGDRATKLGLRGMQFRVESLGGTLRVDIGTHGKTTVRADIPCGAPPPQVVSS